MSWADEIGGLLGSVNQGVSGIADIYVKLNQAKIDSGLSSQSNTIDELKNSITLMQQSAQLQAQYAANAAAQSSVNNPMIVWALVAGGLLLAYKLIK